MTSKTFVDKETIIDADWLNDVDRLAYGPATKTIAKTLTPVDGAKIYPQGSDGGVFIGGTNVVGYYNDDGTNGSYGTKFKPTGGDGSAGWERDFTGPRLVEWYGAVGDYVLGVNAGTVDTPAFQLAINSLGGGAGEISGKAKGYYFGTQALEIKGSDQSLIGSGFAGIGIGWNGVGGPIVHDNPLAGAAYARFSLKGFFVQAWNINGYALDVSGFSYSDFDGGYNIRSTATNGVLLYGIGNDAGSAPYYNNISGQFSGGGLSTQTGVLFESNESTGLIASGGNGNNFSNIKRLHSVGIAFDIRAGVGNLGSNIQLEDIKTTCFRFNNRAADYSGTATSGTRNILTDTSATFVVAKTNSSAIKITGGTGSGQSALVNNATTTSVTIKGVWETIPDATSTYEITWSKTTTNRFTGARVEGAVTAKFADFKSGSKNNSIESLDVGSISAIQWTRDINENSNFVNYGDGLIPFHYHVENVAASTTVALKPIGLANVQGGYAVGFDGFVEMVTIAGNARGTGSAGSAIAKVYVGASQATPSPSLTGNNAAYNISKAALLEYNSGSADRAVDGDQIRVDVTTDVAWDTPTSDIAVTVYVRKT